MYAVVAINGHQWLVKQWDEIIVDHIDAQEWDNLEFDTVLCVFDESGETVKVWEPYLPGKLSASVVSQQKGKKVKVVKFQSKKRYHRNKGFRQSQTTLSIDKIPVDGK